MEENSGAFYSVLDSSFKRYLSAKFKVPAEELTKAADLSLQADFTDPKSIKAIFDEVKQKLGVPNVVVYNGSSLRFSGQRRYADEYDSCRIDK